MKKFLLAILCIAISAMLIACSTSSATKKTKNSKATDESKSITKEYKGLSFKIPSDSEYTEAEDSVTIIFEAKKKFVTIIPTDTSALNQDLSDAWNGLSITSILDGFDDVQNQKDSDTTISDVPAKCTTALVQLSNSWYNYSITAFVSKDKKYQYSICYTTSEDAGTDNSVYESFLDSISFQ